MPEPQFNAKNRRGAGGKWAKVNGTFKADKIQYLMLGNFKTTKTHNSRLTATASTTLIITWMMCW
jgi:hypothetical protein